MGVNLQVISNHDIVKIIQNELNFQGVFMRTEKLPRTGCFVLNLDELEDPGTHWVSVYNNEYYDSFCLPPPKKLEKRISWYNTRQHQNVNSKLCGINACYYIQSRNKDITPYEICYEKLKTGGNIRTLLKKYKFDSE